jgi:hypothetical protein
MGALKGDRRKMAPARWRLIRMSYLEAAIIDHEYRLDPGPRQRLRPPESNGTEPRL